MKMLLLAVVKLCLLWNLVEAQMWGNVTATGGLPANAILIGRNRETRPVYIGR